MEILCEPGRFIYGDDKDGDDETYKTAGTGGRGLRHRAVRYAQARVALTIVTGQGHQSFRLRCRMEPGNPRADPLDHLLFVLDDRVAELFADEELRIQAVDRSPSNLAQCSAPPAFLAGTGSDRVVPAAAASFSRGHRRDHPGSISSPGSLGAAASGSQLECRSQNRPGPRTDPHWTVSAFAAPDLHGDARHVPGNGYRLQPIPCVARIGDISGSLPAKNPAGRTDSAADVWR